MIYKHPDGKYHPYPPRAAKLTPIAGRPNWFTNQDGAEVYVEPPKPKVDPLAPMTIGWATMACMLFFF